MTSRVRRFQSALVHESDAALRERSLVLQSRAQSGERLPRILPEAYALVGEAARRCLGMQHYPEQLEGAIHLADRRIVEMETGEGKTFTATLPVYLYALCGNGVHVATANDYLAARDARLNEPLFAMLSMNVGVITSNLPDDKRRQSYTCDITYGSATEFGFDFLRDRLKRRAHETGQGHGDPVMRDLFFVLADEADAIMIDEANTPLILGAKGMLTDTQRTLFKWAARLADHAEEREHYTYDVREKRVELTRAGREWARRQAGESLAEVSALERYEKLEFAISVSRDFHRDQAYIVRNGEVVLVSSATGRLSEGRQWQDGIHQSIQAREGLEITAPNTHAAKLTIQSLFLSYRHLAGMTGTALQANYEFRKVYKLEVIRIRPHRRNRRRTLKERFFSIEAEKWQAITDEIVELQRDGRPVLIGTRSVAKSEQLSEILRRAGIEHRILNARAHEKEAEIVADAGKRGQVTVATGMAGRGTDIELGEGVGELGGLHVILTELHDSPRMDRQLVGRCARQGDPGSFRQYLSGDDEILEEAYGADRAQSLGAAKLRRSAGWLYAAQARVERMHRNNRLTFLYHDKRRLRSLWESGADPVLDSV